MKKQGVNLSLPSGKYKFPERASSTGSADFVLMEM